MKKEIHPTYEKSVVICASCGTTFETRSTIPQISVEICSVCHPFYTGKQKLIDTAGRVDRFKERVRASQKMQQTKAPKSVAKEADTVELPDAEPAPEEATPAAE